MDNQTALISPHVFIFPLPLQGPVNSMLKLAEILCLNNIKVTFLNTQYIQQRLSECTITEKYFEKYPNFSFQTVPDGLSEDNPRSVYQFSDLVESLEAVALPVFRQMLTSGPRVTCLIVDAIYSFAMDIAQEIQVPLLLFDTISPCTVWIYLCLSKLIQAGELPFKGDSLDKFVMNATAMEGIIRFRDLPSFCRKNSIINNSDLQLALNEVKHIPQSQGLILNTFQELDGPVLSQLRNICPNVYAIGPVHAHLKTRLAGPEPEVQHTISSCIWKEDRSCISWLNKQPSKSVIYVSIGSLAVMTKDQLFEIWHGLVNSGSRFLWVRRPGSVVGLDSEPDQVPLELIIGTKERGCIVSWAPQEEVLAHPAVGGFFTHSGWNSTLESIVEGKPMICWPSHADQQVNSRYVEKVWKLGFDMKDSCDRVTIEMMIRELMELRNEEFLERAEKMAKLAYSSVRGMGSSFIDLDRLIEDIKMMKIV